MNRHLSCAIIGAISLTLTVPTLAALADSGREADSTPQPIHKTEGQQRPNSWIVLAKKQKELQANTDAMVAKTDQLVSQARSAGITITHEYPVFGGYAGTMTDDQVAKLKSDPSLDVMPNRDLYAPITAEADIVDMTDQNWIDLMKNQSKGKTVVVFGKTSHCGACEKWLPKVKKFNEDDKGSWKLAVWQAETNPISEKWMNKAQNENYVPFMLAWRDGKKIARLTPRAEDAEVRNWLNQVAQGRVPTGVPTLNPNPAPKTQYPTEFPTDDQKPTTSAPATSAPPTSALTNPPTTKVATTKINTTRPITTRPTWWPSWWTSKPMTTAPSKPTTAATKPTNPTKPTKPVTSAPATSTAPTVPGDVQANAPWNLDLIDSRDGKKDTKFAAAGTGKGVNIYVVDSGVDKNHEEFTGRIEDGYSAIKDKPATSDELGHGTHVASTAAGSKYGVAKQATIVPVRIFDGGGHGEDADALNALQWVAKNFKAPGLVQASWGDHQIAETLDKAAQLMVDMGVPFVNAAGNDHKDACQISPTHIDQLIRVGATDNNMKFASNYSNYGKCVDILAPGTNISAAWAGTKNLYTSKQGTSMAAPHVAGGVAIYLQSHPQAKAAEVKKAMIDNGSKNIVSGVGNDTANVFLYVGK